MPNKPPVPERRKLTPLKIVSYAGFSIAAVVLLCAAALLLFPDPVLNRFIKPRLTGAFSAAYPAYSMRIDGMNYGVLQNRFGCDSVVVNATDGTATLTVSSFSVSGIAWAHLLWGGELAIPDFSGAAGEAREIVLTLQQSQYELRCERLRLSIPDSTMVVDSLEVHPLGDDEEFFRGSRFRRTRFDLVAPRSTVLGLACLDLFQGRNYRLRSARVDDLFLDVLCNKDLPGAKDTVPVLMPNEMLASMPGTLQVDSVSIMNGGLRYGERFAVGATPALITFDSIGVLARGIANHGERNAEVVVRAQGMFMNAGTMNVVMSFPVASPVFSYHYAGSMSSMDTRAINLFLETAEHMRIKSGVLKSATFDISVVSGRATGNVRAVYRDFTLAAIDKHTRSEKGLADGITSFIANTFKIRGTNVPDESGAIKIGRILYTRKRDDPFFRFTWFALRSGLKDVVGF